MPTVVINRHCPKHGLEARQFWLVTCPGLFSLNRTGLT